MADMCECGEAPIIGAVYWFWSMADEHTKNGELPGLSLATIDRKTGVAGLGEAMVSVGWLIESETGLTIPNFDEHNGRTAKKRALDSRRQENKRKENGECIDEIESVRDSSLSSVTDCGQKADNSVTYSKSKSKSNKEKNNKKKKPDLLCFDDLVFPQSLDNQACRQALTDWLDYRIEIGKPCKSKRGVAAILKKFSDRTAEQFCAAVTHSMASGYQGLFEPSGNRGSPRQDNSPQAKRERTQQALIDAGKEIYERHAGSQNDVPGLCESNGSSGVADLF